MFADFSQGVNDSSSGASFLSHSIGSSDSRPSLLGRADMRHRGDGQDDVSADRLVVRYRCDIFLYYCIVDYKYTSMIIS